MLDQPSRAILGQIVPVHNAKPGGNAPLDAVIVAEPKLRLIDESLWSYHLVLE